MFFLVLLELGLGLVKKRSPTNRLTGVAQPASVFIITIVNPEYWRSQKKTKKE